MPNRNYVRGRQAEYKARRQLEQEKWSTHRSAGSHGVDLVCIRGTPLELLHDLLYVSVKSGKRRPGKRDLQELRRALPRSVPREIWYYAPRQPVEIIPV